MGVVRAISSQFFEYGCRRLLSDVDGLRSFAYEHEVLKGSEGTHMIYPSFRRGVIWINDRRLDSAMRPTSEVAHLVDCVVEFLEIFSERFYFELFGEESVIVRVDAESVAIQPL